MTQRVAAVVASGLAAAVAAILMADGVATRRTAAATGPRSQSSPAVRLVQIAALEQPIGAYSRPDNPLLYVVEKTGRLKTLSPDGTSQTILDLSDKVSTQNERGLLSVAFPPDLRARIYVSYTDPSGALTISEFSTADSPIDATTERTLMRIPHPNDDHNGGALAFDGDGLLYIGVGDGGGVGTKGGIGDRDNNAQNPAVLLGKILRIDPQPAAGSPYRIPRANPFAGGPALGPTGRSRRPEIFAYGLRNPWRLSIDAGYLWVPDVGQSTWEEINRISTGQVGANFGWRLREGKHAYRGGARPKDSVDPVHEYQHTNGRCAVIGGTVAGKASGPQLAGTYVFGDLCSGRFIQLRDAGTKRQTTTDLGARLAYLTSVSSGPGGTLIATSLNGGVYRIESVP